MYRSFALIFVVALLCAPTAPLAAQDTAPITPSPTPLGLPSAASSSVSPLNCFDHYRFGSVSADLQPSLGQSVPGTVMTFSGEVINNNAYPLIDGTLYVKIFKRDDNTFASGDGNPVVDQFVVKDNILLSANDKLPVTYQWKIPNNAEGGEYYAAYFFTTAKRYNLMGLSFTDDVVGNQAPFIITNETDPKVATLSKTDTTLNGQDHHFAAFPLHFTAGDDVTVETTITNPGDSEKKVPLQWNQYSWDAINPSNLRFTKTEVVTLSAGETKTVKYQVQPQRESIVYITAITQDVEAKSILDIRYVRDGIEETRINFPSVSAFPLAKNSTTTLFSCAHSTNLPLVSGNILTLTLTDKDGKVIQDYRYEGDISGAMGGYGETFTAATNINYAVLTARLERNGVTVEEVKTVYDCKAIDATKCLSEEGRVGAFDWLTSHRLIVLMSGVILLLILAIIAFLIKKRRNHIDASDSPMTTPMAALFLAFIIPSLFFLVPLQSEAKSIVWSTTSTPELWYYWNWAGFSPPPNTSGYAPGLASNPSVTVTYNANLTDDTTGAAITDGSSLAQGTIIKCEAPYSNSDIFWNGTGYSGDSPYGHWVDNAASPGDHCQAGDIVAYDIASGGSCPNPYYSWGGPFSFAHAVNVFIPFSVHRPSSVCLLTGPVTQLSADTWEVTGGGTIAASVTFPATYGKFYYGMEETSSYICNQISAGCAQNLVPLNIPSNISSGGCVYNSSLGIYECPNNSFDAANLVEQYQVDIPTQVINFFINTAAAAAPASCTATPVQTCVESWCEADNNIAVNQPRASGANPGGVTAITTWDVTVGTETGQFDSTCTSDPSDPNICTNTENYTLGGSNFSVVVSASNRAPGGNRDSYAAISSVSCSSAPSVGNPPNAPTISGPTDGAPNTNYAFDFTATDSDGDQLRYGIDWNEDSNVDEWLPGSGYVNSGTNQSQNRVWASNGSYTFQALTQDAQGNSSGWTSHTITITSGVAGCGGTGIVSANCSAGENVVGTCAPTERWVERPTAVFNCPGPSGWYYGPPYNEGPIGRCVADAACVAATPTTDFKINASDGPLSVNKNTALNLTWTAADTSLTTCTLYGPGALAGGVAVAQTGSMTVTAASSDTFVLYCGPGAGESDSVGVTVVNQGPNPPTINYSSGNLESNQSITFTIQATDPDGDTIFYEVDWDNNGTTDATTMTVASGTIQPATHSWTTSGTVTFQARTVDQPSGAVSAWTTHSVTLVAIPATATLEASINGGAYTTADTIVDPGDTIVIRWSSTNSTGCLATAGSGFAASGQSGTDPVNTPAANSSDTFTATCAGSGGGGTDNIVISTRQKPNFNKPSVTTQNIGSLIAGTATYSSVDVYFATANDGGSVTKAAAPYLVEVTSIAPISGTIPSGLNPGPSGYNNTVTIPGPISFGTTTVKVSIDTPIATDGAVSEVTEGDADNTRTTVFTIPPPDPGLRVSADRYQLRNGDTTTISWSITTTYPGLSCRIIGPGISASTQSGSQLSSAITAKSEYAFSCTETTTGTTWSKSAYVDTQGVLEEI